MPDSPKREAHYEVARFGDSKLKADVHYPEFVAPLARTVAREFALDCLRQISQSGCPDNRQLQGGSGVSDF